MVSIKILLAALVLGSCQVWAVQADDEIALVLKLESEFVSFGARFERRLRQVLKSQPEIDLMSEDFLMGNHPYALRMTVRYPVKVFEGEAGCYVKIVGLASGDRYVYYYHDSVRNGDLSLTESQRLADQVSESLNEVLLKECGFLKGERLQPGPYANKKKLNLGEPLQVELLGSSKVDWRTLAISETQKQEQAEETSLLEEKRAEASLPDLDAPMPESRREALREQQIVKKLDQTWVPEDRAELYRQLSSLYERNGLKGDARLYAYEAFKEDRSPVSMGRVRQLDGIETHPTARFRRANMDRNLMLLFQNELRYDSNVVLEEVDNFSPTDTRDWVISNGLHLEKEWSWRLGSIVPNTSYHVRHDKYTRHEDLDLLSQRLGQEFSWGESLAGGIQTWRLGLGYNDYTKRGKGLMRGMDLQLGASWMHSVRDIFSLSFAWQEKNYSDRFYSKAERDGDVMRVEGSWRKKFEADQILIGRIGILKDDIGDPTLSYQAYTLDVNYDATSPWKWLGVLTGKFGYEMRSYDQPEFGRAFERQDAKFEYGIESRNHPFPAHTFRMGYLHTDGQSTRRVSFYRREQVFFNYDVAF
jgi:hypothetical protein